MKNKKNLYILLPAVLVIWSLVIYRFYKGLNPSATEISTSEMTTTFTPKLEETNTAFTIKADYRDPFLGTLSNKKNTVKRVVPTQNMEPEEPFPTIMYKGLVATKGTNNRVFLIGINGEQHYFKVRSTYNGITLLAGNSKEVILQYQNRRQTFAIEN